MFTNLVYLIENIALGLYIASTGGILYMAYRLHRARRELSVSQFTLEREHALVRQASAITFGGLLIEFAIGIWAIANLMAPTVRDIELGQELVSVPIGERFVTSTPAPNAPINLGGAQGAVDEGPDIFTTPVPTVTPVGTIMPEAPDIVGCARDSAWIHIPGNGQLIFEATTIYGTANISDFASYRFEIKPETAGSSYRTIGDNPAPVIDGPLGEILPFQFPNGEYRFRLVVFDHTMMLRALCEITIHISDPPPTPTPIGGGP